jgi:hypothetical protein
MTLNWIKAPCSGADCVELAALPDGTIAIRDSKRPNAPALVFTKSEVAAFFVGVREYDFDQLLGKDKLQFLASAVIERSRR